MQGAIVVGLKNRLKERRRVKKPRKTVTDMPAASIACIAPRSPSIPETDRLTIPPGEDKNSFERHNRVLKAEFSKSKPNGQVVKELMELTFSMRRTDILSQGHSYDPVSKYPFLQVADHVRD